MTAALIDHLFGFGRVVIATGHMTDAPGRAAPRFPESRVDRVAARVAGVFDDWVLGLGDLLICGGARGGDLLAARAARARGAAVWVVLAHPADEFVETSVAGSADCWIGEFWEALAHCPSWTVPDARRDAADNPYAAANSWMLDIARTQAAEAALSVVAVWDGLPAPGTGGTGDMVDATLSSGADVAIIDPMHA